MLAEAALVARLRARDPAAYAEAVAAHSPRMRSAASRYLERAEDVEDAVQEAWVCAFRGIAGFREGAKLSTWLHRIAVNRALMIRRARRCRPAVSLPATFDCPDPAAAEAPADGAERPRRAVEALPEGYRRVAALHGLYGASVDDVAALVGMTPGAVKSRLWRARELVGSAG